MEPTLKYKPYSFVLAMEKKNRGIGLKGDMPWPPVPHDWAHFNNVSLLTDLALTPRELAAKNSFYYSQDLFTSENVPEPKRYSAVIMGRKSWESTPQRPLLGRLNIILTSDTQYQPQYNQEHIDTP